MGYGIDLIVVGAAPFLTGQVRPCLHDRPLPPRASVQAPAGCIRAGHEVRAEFTVQRGAGLAKRPRARGGLNLFKVFAFAASASCILAADLPLEHALS